MGVTFESEDLKKIWDTFFKNLKAELQLWGVKNKKTWFKIYWYTQIQLKLFKL